MPGALGKIIVGITHFLVVERSLLYTTSDAEKNFAAN
jgi:hypothetical protein